MNSFFKPSMNYQHINNERMTKENFKIWASNQIWYSNSKVNQWNSLAFECDRLLLRIENEYACKAFQCN